MNDPVFPLPQWVRNPLLLTVMIAGVLFHSNAASASDDEQRGAALFAGRCAACHSINPTRKPGPILSGVYGRRAGTAPNYQYSAALQGASLTWSDRTLDRWLTNPPAFIPGVNMQAQVTDPNDRLALIRYLKSISPRTGSAR